MNRALISDNAGAELWSASRAVRFVVADPPFEQGVSGLPSSCKISLMPHEGQEIKRANGFVVKIVTLENELLEVEARYRGDAPLAQAHYHPRQDEHFEVLEGTIHAVIGGAEQWYREGETFDVPAGTPHQMAADGPTRIRWQVRPALRTAEFFERFYYALDNGFPAGTSREEFLADYADVFRLTQAEEDAPGR